MSISRSAMLTNWSNRSRERFFV